MYVTSTLSARNIRRTQRIAKWRKMIADNAASERDKARVEALLAKHFGNKDTYTLRRVKDGIVIATGLTMTDAQVKVAKARAYKKAMLVAV